MWYRVEATIDDLGKVPFVIGVSREHPDGWIRNGDERLPLVVVQRSPLVLRIPVRGAQLEFGPEGPGGVLTGHWRVKYFFKRDFDIVAEPIVAPRIDLVFPGEAAPTSDLSGTWKISVEEFGVGRARFHQDAHGNIGGTIIPPEVGDLRLLTGRVIGDHARLSAFDGIHGFLVEMTASDNAQKLSGRWLVSGIGSFSFTATREEAPPTHLSVSAHLASGKTTVTLPALHQAPFAGNPVIVDYFGSWCPVCLDLTPELVRLHREHAAEGLQIMSIALEPTGDDAEARHRLEDFRATFGITWPFDVRFTDDFGSSLPPEVLEATGFPVTIFVRRDGTVAAIHSGFVSAAAGAEHDAVVKQFDVLAAQISAPAKQP